VHLPPRFAFRPATAADVDDIVALVESAYRGDASRAGWTTEADLLEGQRTDREDVEATIADPAVCLILAFEADTLMGSVVLRAQPPASAYIGMFAVRPTQQGRGVGDALLREAERRARSDLRAQLTRMTVIEQRPELLAWYIRKGYRPTGEKQPFPYDNPRSGLPLRPDLCLVVLEKEVG
jgi:ribosomal protein S18 acetylase RimI-like enzyme